MCLLHTVLKTIDNMSLREAMTRSDSLQD